jgi:hypothetical protein
LTTEVGEVKTVTGLPELPEGYFWRVGEKDTNPGWYDKKPRMESAVFIMRKAVMETKTREIPVYGTNWWQKNTVVDTITETYTEMGEPTEAFSQTFSGIHLARKEDLPEIGRISSWTSDAKGVEYDWRYDVPVGPKGVALLAGMLYKRMLAHQESTEAYRKFKAAQSKVKEELYGDYPPKSLVGATVEIAPVETATRDMMAELDKLLEKFEELSQEYPDAPPYTKGRSAAMNDAAVMLKEVIRG